MIETYDNFGKWMGLIMNIHWEKNVLIYFEKGCKFLGN